MSVDPAQLAAWRAKCADGSITQDEYRQAIAHLREDRYRARPQPKAPKPRKSRKKATSEEVAALIDQPITEGPAPP